MGRVKSPYFEGCPYAERTQSFPVERECEFGEVGRDALPPGHPLELFSSPSFLKEDELIYGTFANSQEVSCTKNAPRL